jgi:hypothetical protein
MTARPRGFSSIGSDAEGLSDTASSDDEDEEESHIENAAEA